MALAFSARPRRCFTSISKTEVVLIRPEPLSPKAAQGIRRTLGNPWGCGQGSPGWGEVTEPHLAGTDSSRRWQWCSQWLSLSRQRLSLCTCGRSFPSPPHPAAGPGQLVNRRLVPACRGTQEDRSGELAAGSQQEVTSTAQPLPRRGRAVGSPCVRSSDGQGARGVLHAGSWSLCLAGGRCLCDSLGESGKASRSRHLGFT